MISALPNHRDKMARFHLSTGDAVGFLQGLPDESVDMVATDPAYESLEKHRAKGTTTRLKVSEASSNEWFEIFPNSRFPAFFAECHRVLKRGTHLYVMCDQETAFIIKPMGEAAGFKFWKALVWVKPTIGMGYHYRARHELVLFFEKGKRRLNDLGIGDVLEAPRVRNGYPTEKPVTLCEVLVKQSTSPGELVVDPFMGSASAGVAALSHGRDFMGNDVSPKALALATERLSGFGTYELTSWLPRVWVAGQQQGQLSL